MICSKPFIHSRPSRLTYFVQGSQYLFRFLSSNTLLSMGEQGIIDFSIPKWKISISGCHARILLFKNILYGLKYLYILNFFFHINSLFILSFIFLTSCALLVFNRHRFIGIFISWRLSQSTYWLATFYRIFSYTSGDNITAIGFRLFNHHITLQVSPSNKFISFII